MDNKQKCLDEFVAYFDMNAFEKERQKYGTEAAVRTVWGEAWNRRAPAPQAAQPTTDTPAWLKALPEGEEAGAFHGQAIVFTDEQLIAYGLECGHEAAATSPAPAVVQMTDEQIDSVMATCMPGTRPSKCFRDFARAILNEVKNG